MDYAFAVGRLLACPFCREMFAEDEGTTCPQCDIPLERMEKLPPSLEAMAEAVEDGDLQRPEERTLPFWYYARGRGALLVLAVLGLALFFAPWVAMSKPHDVLISAYDLARTRAGWLWGGAVGWFIMIPLVASRRSMLQMRGVRIITAMFAAMTLIEIIMLLSLPPQSRPLHHRGVCVGMGAVRQRRRLGARSLLRRDFWRAHRRPAGDSLGRRCRQRARRAQRRRGASLIALFSSGDRVHVVPRREGVAAQAVGEPSLAYRKHPLVGVREVPVIALGEVTRDALLHDEHRPCPALGSGMLGNQEGSPPLAPRFAAQP